MSTPKPPPRITEVNANPDRPHTPPPPAMPMAPPREYAAPRGRLPSHHDVEIAEESDEGDRPSRLEQEEFGRAVHVRYGKLRVAIPLTLAGILLGGGGVVGYERIHESTPQAAALSDSARDALNAEVLNRLTKLEAKIDANKASNDTDQKLLIQRVGALETEQGATKAGVQAILVSLSRR
jgi:hypothetical protein